uniref:Uncharacterized protein n=1 Tax=Triticum urartu TaxID=4572 RepID=A0A8R7QUT7_TRIUA
RRLFSAAGHRSQWQLLPADQVRSHRTLIPSSCETICLLPLLKSEVLADPDRKNHAQPPHSAAPVSPTPAAPPILLISPIRVQRVFHGSVGRAMKSGPHSDDGLKV